MIGGLYGEHNKYTYFEIGPKISSSIDGSFTITFDDQTISYNGTYIKTSEKSTGLPVYQLNGNTNITVKYYQNSGNEWQISFVDTSISTTLVKKMNTKITEYTIDNIGGEYKIYYGGSDTGSVLNATVTI